MLACGQLVDVAEEAPPIIVRALAAKEETVLGIVLLLGLYEFHKAGPVLGCESGELIHSLRQGVIFRSRSELGRWVLWAEELAGCH